MMASPQGVRAWGIMIEVTMIVKRDAGWVLLTKARDRVLGGPYKTRDEAVKREQQVLLFKRLRELEAQVEGGTDGKG